MKISYSYRGQKTELCSDFKRPQFANNGTVAVDQNSWTDGIYKHYMVEIEPHELLVVAQDCLRQLSAVSGVDYMIFVSVNRGNPQKLV